VRKVILFFMLIGLVVIYPNIWYVDTTGNEADSLKAAIDSASASPGIDTVILSIGTFDLGLNGVELKDSLVLLGSKRDSCILTHVDRCMHLLYGSNLHYLLLKNLTVKDVKRFWLDQEGVALIFDSSHVKIESCTIANNEAVQKGGGILMKYGKLEISYSTIKDNKCLIYDNRYRDAMGGGICAIGVDTLRLTRVVIRGNHSSKGGGGIYIEDSYLESWDSGFVGNESDSSSGGLYASRNSRFNLFNTLFQENTGKEGGAIGVAGTSSGYIQGSWIIFNRAENGGAVFTEENGRMDLNWDIVACNTATEKGGAFYCTDTSYLNLSQIFAGDNINLNTLYPSGFAYLTGMDTLHATGSNIYHNSFLQDTELINTTSIVQPMENNFWWFTDSLQIDSIISGPVDFSPFSLTRGGVGELERADSIFLFQDKDMTIPYNLLTAPDTVYIRIYGFRRTQPSCALAICKSSVYPDGIVVMLSERDPYVFEGKVIVQPPSPTQDQRRDDADGVIRCKDPDSLVVYANINPNVITKAYTDSVFFNKKFLSFSRVLPESTGNCTLYLKNVGTNSVIIESISTRIFDAEYLGTLPDILPSGDSIGVRVGYTAPAYAPLRERDTLRAFFYGGGVAAYSYLTATTLRPHQWYVDTSGYEADSISLCVIQADSQPGRDTLFFAPGTYLIDGYRNGNGVPVYGDIVFIPSGERPLITSRNSLAFLVDIFSTLRIKNFDFTQIYVGGSSNRGCINASGNLIVDSCTFENFNATEYGYSYVLHGGGALIIKNSSFTNNIVIDAVINGAGIYIENCIFENNTNTLNGGSGGAIYQGGGTLTILNSLFRNNRADYGAGVFAFNVNGEINGCKFYNNHANIRGGGVYLVGSQISVDVKNSAFYTNYGEESGSGIFTAGGTANISTSTFLNNLSGSHGGSFMANGGNLLVDSCLIIDNGSLDSTNSGVGYVAGDDTLFIQYSNVYYNTYQNDVEYTNSGSITQELFNNFWWTTDLGEILSMLSGSVDFIPISDSSIPGAPGEPIAVDSIRTYLGGINVDSIGKPETLSVTMYGIDRDTSLIEAGVVIVNSSIYPDGIALGLLETGENTGIYSGSLVVYESDGTDTIRTDDIHQIIRVRPEGDTIRLMANTDTTVTYFVTYKAPTTGISNIPSVFNISAPFNISGRLNYQIPVKTHVRIEVLDIMGRKVSIPVDGIKQPGYYSLHLKLHSGIYFARMLTREYSKTTRMVILR